MPANNFKGSEGVGGKLYLTDKHLVFKSHNFNIQNHQFYLNLTDIKKAERYKPMGITNNGLLITTTGNTTEKFVVEQPDEWMNRINSKILMTAQF